MSPELFLLLCVFVCEYIHLFLLFLPSSSSYIYSTVFGQRQFHVLPLSTDILDCSTSAKPGILILHTVPHELCVLLTSTPDDINSTVVESPLQSRGCELCHLDD